MIAKRSDGKIILLTFCNVFHVLKTRPQNGDLLDKFGRSWSPVLDEQTLLKCYYCETDQVFPDDPGIEAKVRYI